MLGGVLKGEFNYEVKVVHEALQGLELVGSAWGNQEDIIYKPFPEGDCPDKGFADRFFLAAYEKAGIWWGSFGAHGCAYQFEKMLIH